MRRFLIVLLALCIAVRVSAQTRPAQPGDPPVLSRIEVSPPDRFGQVLVTGSNGAVFPNAYVGVRNLFTGDTVYARAGITGSFVVQIIGTLDTPYWISPAGQDTPREERSLPGSMPGGPGAILMPQIETTELPQLITRIAIDGTIGDWATYADSLIYDAGTRTIYALRNNESIYVGIGNAQSIPEGSTLQLDLTIDGVTYAIRIDPAADGTAALERVNPNQAQLGTLGVSIVRREAVEVRVPLSFVDRSDNVQLDSVRWLDETNTTRINDAITAPVMLIDETDGIVRINSEVASDSPVFAIGGGQIDALTLTGWMAHGRTSTIQIEPGNTWVAEFDVTLDTVDLPADAQIVADIAFQPIAQVLSETDENNVATAVSGYMTNNGWSHRLTPTGMPIDGQLSATLLGSAAAQPNEIVRREDITLYPLDFAVPIPRDLPPGLYIPVMQGYVESASGRVRWDQNEGDAPTRLPIVVNVGGVETAELPFTLFADDLSDGSRGILPDEQSTQAALSNRVRFNSPTIILPPFTSTAPRRPIPYAIEPYLPDLLPNLYDVNGIPLIPLQLPGGRLTAQIELPSGQIDDLGNAPFLQNRLSTATFDERDLFGTASPVDMLRLTTLDPRFTEYAFSEYGDYTITMSGTVEDIWGNTYSGGGEYHVVAAELLDMTPGVMPGTPFVVGDTFNPGLRITPGFSADVTITLRFSPIDGGETVEQVWSGTADSIGQFLGNIENDVLVFDEAGEYVIDYEARYRSIDGNLWAGSLRSAGVVAPAIDSPIEAHGERGVDPSASFRPAWFDLARYAEINGLDADDATLHLPYHSGDLLWVIDGVDGDIDPAITLQDRDGSYAAWLSNADSTSIVPTEAIERQIAQQEMPVAPEAGYVYVSAVRPNVTLRQFVGQSGADGLPLDWDNDDPLNRQIGAGIDGSVADDILFLFGGAVVRTPDGEATTAGYAASAVVIAPEAEPGERVYPPGRGRDGGGDGGALVTFNDVSYDALIVPTGLQPADVITAGETFNFTGQVAPTLQAVVRVTYTKPSGETMVVEGTANAYGYFYNPDGALVADQSGIWSARVEVIYAGRTSVGIITAPGISGGILGTTNGRFDFYVLPQNNEPLPWNAALTDSIIAIGLPYNFNFTLPVGWTNIRAFFTMTTPGYVLTADALRVSGRSFSYTYIAPTLAQQISILESESGTSGNWVSDVRELTFVAVGTDENGNPAIRARTFTLMHDRLVTQP